MNNTEKRRTFVAEMNAIGQSQHQVAPWMFRCLWKIGIEVPPPLFCSFPQQLLTTGIFGATFWGLAMWLMMFRHAPVWITIVASCLFGLWMASWFWFLSRRKRRILGLCDNWSDYPQPNKKMGEQVGAGDAE